MKTIMLSRASQAALMLFPLALAGTGCGGDTASGVTCGPGTLQNSQKQCIPNGNFNVVVDDFTIGQYQMTAVDVPENLEVGSPDTRTFTIKNVGEEDREVVYVRFGIVPVQSRIEELQDILDNLDADTELDATVIGSVYIDNLKAGESRQVSYELAVPASVDPGLYGLYFAVDEVPLVKTDDGSYALDLLHSNVAKQDGDNALAHAALVHAPATVIVGKPDKPNLRVLFAKVDNASFVLDSHEQGDKEPLFTVTSRISSQALDTTEEVAATYELRLPGHVIDVPGQDLGPGYFESDDAFAAAPAKSTWRYDANRTFALKVNSADGFTDAAIYHSQCRTETFTDENGTASDVERCAVVFNEEGRDGLVSLHLDPADEQLLASTLDHAAENPGLDAHGEIHGQLVMKISSTQAEYQNNTADNEKAIDVVFMAPELARAADEADKDDGGVAQTPTAWGDSGPYPYVTTDSHKGQSFGNEWFGFGYSLDNTASVSKLNDAVIAHYKSSQASMDATILKQKLTIFGGGGTVDWGADKGTEGFKASAKVTVLGYTLLNFTFAPSLCTTSDNVTLCPLFGSEIAPAQKKDIKSKAPPRSLLYYKGIEKEFFFTLGPVPFTIETSVGASLGMGVYGALVLDRRGTVPKSGFQLAFGPTAELSADVFGGVTAGLAKAGVEGNLSLITISLIPYFMPTAGMIFDTSRACFKAAEARLDFVGPLTIEGPHGSVGIAGYVGYKACIPYIGCSESWTKVFGFTVASFSTVTWSYNLWDLTTSWLKKPGDAGMCPDALASSTEASWRSPTSCNNGYCSNSSTNKPGMSAHSPANVLDAYKTSYTLVGGTTNCVDVHVTGTVRKNEDVVVIYDKDGAPQNVGRIDEVLKIFGRSITIPDGKPTYGWDGAIDQTQRVCSTPVTVALESGSNVSGQSGVTVTITPN